MKEPRVANNTGGNTFDLASQIPHETVFKINDEHIDRHGHVSNVYYVEMIEITALEHLSVSRTIEEYIKLGTGWFAKNHNVTYVKPILEGDTIVVKTRFEKMKRTSVVQGFEFINKADDSLVCKAESIWVYIDQKTGRPQRIDNDLKRPYFPNDAIAS